MLAGGRREWWGPEGRRGRGEGGRGERGGLAGWLLLRQGGHHLASTTGVAGVSGDVLCCVWSGGVLTDDGVLTLGGSL